MGDARSATGAPSSKPGAAIRDAAPGTTSAAGRLLLGNSAIAPRSAWRYWSIHPFGSNGSGAAAHPSTRFSALRAMNGTSPHAKDAPPGRRALTDQGDRAPVGPGVMGWLHSVQVPSGHPSSVASMMPDMDRDRVAV